VRNDKVNATSADVSEWAEGILGEWMPGYTHDEDGTQYKIVHVGPQRYQVQSADFADRREARVFTVQVIVSEQR
jgi:hypothetical protein